MYHDCITIQVVPLISQCYGCSTVLISMCLYMVHRDEFRDTQSTETLIVPSMIHHVSLFTVRGYETFTTLRTLTG